MKVLKFGGTSVGTVKSLGNVKQIVENLHEPAVVVVSALGGITDKLINTAEKAAEGDRAYIDQFNEIADRHHSIIAETVPTEKIKDCDEKVSKYLTELKKLYDGLALIKDLPAKTLDNIVSFGERMSSIIVSEMIPSSSHIDSLEIIKTEKWFDKNIAATDLTTVNIISTIKPKEGEPIIAGGFISTDKESGEITNLGRGGSDFTAALIAAALKADILEIWTDVDGFMTSDPRIINEARIIPEMSFVESMELCSFGAKVIYPPTIYPVFHKNIPIKILNTFNPDAPGTYIKDFPGSHWKKEDRVRGLSVLKDTTLFTITGEVAENIAFVNSRTYNILAKNGIGVFLVSPTEESAKFSFVVKSSDRDKTSSLIAKEFAPELGSGEIDSVDSLSGLSIIAIVGDNISAGKPISPRIFNTLIRNGIESPASSEGASKTTVTFVVKEEEANKALQLIHSLFFV